MYNQVYRFLKTTGSDHSVYTICHTHIVNSDLMLVNSVVSFQPFNKT